MYENINAKRKIGAKEIALSGVFIAISIILTRVFAIMIPLAGLPALRIGFGAIPIQISGILMGPVIGGIVGVIADLLGFIMNPGGGVFFPGFTLTAALNGIIPGLLFNYFRKNKGNINYNIINTIITVLISMGIVFIMFQNEVLKAIDGSIYLYDGKLSVITAGAYILLVALFILVPTIMTKKYKSDYEKYSMDKVQFVVTVSYLLNSMLLNTVWLSILFSKGFLVFLPGRVLAGLFIIPIHSIILYMVSRTFRYID